MSARGSSKSARTGAHVMTIQNYLKMDVDPLFQSRPSNLLIPVMINGEKNYVYEARDIMHWLSQNPTSPTTRGPVLNPRNEGLVVVQKGTGEWAHNLAKAGEAYLRDLGWKVSTDYIERPQGGGGSSPLQNSANNADSIQPLQQQQRQPPPPPPRPENPRVQNNNLPLVRLIVGDDFDVDSEGAQFILREAMERHPGHRVQFVRRNEGGSGLVQRRPQPQPQPPQQSPYQPQIRRHHGHHPRGFPTPMYSPPPWGGMPAPYPANMQPSPWGGSPQPQPFFNGVLPPFFGGMQSPPQSPQFGSMPYPFAPMMPTLGV